MLKKIRWMGMALVLHSAAVQADVRSDDHPDLLFVLWDPVAKVSYSKDLGLDANSFWIYAQQDAGYSKQITLDATDIALIEFRKLSTKVADQRWAVIAVDSGPTTVPGDTKLYTTLRQGLKEGETNPNWTDMTGISYGNLVFGARDMPNRLYFGLNFLGDDTTRYVRTAGKDGSSMDLPGSKGYFAGRLGFSDKANPQVDGSYFSGVFDVTNAVNQSSWFYYLTNKDEGGGAIDVDEFDNLSSNGYWGFALTTANAYSLTFTQVVAKSGPTSVSTVVGTNRVSVTDYAAGFEARSITVGRDEFPGWQVAASIAPVPEPATWASFALGLLMLRRAARRSTLWP